MWKQTLKNWNISPEITGCELPDVQELGDLIPDHLSQLPQIPGLDLSGTASAEPAPHLLYMTDSQHH